jgi:hypothetical protein
VGLELHPLQVELTLLKLTFFVLSWIFQDSEHQIYTVSCSPFNKKGDSEATKSFPSRELIRIPVFSSKWLYYSFAFLVFWQFLDGFTTKIGLDLGLAEVGTYSMVVLGNYGFWGLMFWKFGIITAVLAVMLIDYYFAKRYDPTHLNYVTIIFIVACIVAGLNSFLVVSNNIGQIELALHS